MKSHELGLEDYISPVEARIFAGKDDRFIQRHFIRSDGSVSDYAWGVAGRVLVKKLQRAEWHAIFLVPSVGATVIPAKAWNSDFADSALDAGRWPIELSTAAGPVANWQLRCAAGHQLLISRSRIADSLQSSTPDEPQRGRPAKYDWEGAMLNACLWLNRYGAPETNAALEREISSYFAQQGLSPAESAIRDRARRILVTWRSRANKSA